MGSDCKFVAEAAARHIYPALQLGHVPVYWSILSPTKKGLAGKYSDPSRTQAGFWAVACRGNRL